MSEKGGGHTGAMTAGMVGTAIVFFPAAPLLLYATATFHAALHASCNPVFIPWPPAGLGIVLGAR